MIVFGESLSFSPIVLLLEVKTISIWSRLFLPLWLRDNSCCYFPSDKLSSGTLIFLNSNLTKLFYGSHLTSFFLPAAESCDSIEIIFWSHPCLELSPQNIIYGFTVLTAGIVLYSVLKRSDIRLEVSNLRKQWCRHLLPCWFKSKS